MLFTIFQYVVLTEEEVPHRKIELSKKAKSDTDSGGNDDNYTDEENASSNDNSIKGFCENISLDFYYSGSLYHYHTKAIFYSRLTESVATPPPKI